MRNTRLPDLLMFKDTRNEGVALRSSKCSNLQILTDLCHRKREREQLTTMPILVSRPPTDPIFRKRKIAKDHDITLDDVASSHKQYTSKRQRSKNTPIAVVKPSDIIKYLLYFGQFFYMLIL